VTEERWRWQHLCRERGCAITIPLRRGAGVLCEFCGAYGFVNSSQTRVKVIRPVLSYLQPRHRSAWLVKLIRVLWRRFAGGTADSIV
jgi:hypothetical protein